MPRVRRCKYKGCHSYAMFPNYYCDKHINHEAEYQAQRDKYRGVHRSSKATTWKYNHVIRYRSATKTKQNMFYHTREWQVLRRLVFNRDYHLCQYCKNNAGNIVDHIVPIEFDQTKMKDINNLATCCRDCHAKKTRWEQDYYGTGLHNSLKDVPAITDISLINKLMNARNDNIKRSETI
ncbi:HNH endonuclease [Lactobacillus hominis]|uniref:Phage endonuclease n=1 Tax=Lactobacillus hominis DSM 23910 = CRBIP 24.179 TaxID=1423758 RepID=I7LAJ7_9LACO|nr:HNH endonuclease [Lactobacillus hominis]KRM84395.1 phage endonuclease [Lactobacillus hominis DSM 23910 = CRBIP 24.179]MCT3347717.1 HNH endonuclease [Lactobacillus hominis]CCI82309.1 Phage endonuclease [Lactobacillus hominis DSM 23910 = CRBIP 24.179]